jgi:hypothetical protein
MMEMMGLPISHAMLAGHLATSAILSLLVCLTAPYIGRALGLIDDP